MILFEMIREKMQTLSSQMWQELATAHRARAQCWTRPALDRHSRQQSHPVDDFLFTYYSFPLTKIEQWHPGFGVAIACDEEMRPSWMKRHYTLENGHLFADPTLLLDKERARFFWIRELLANTAQQSGNFGCFGMHEWAMVYRSGETRHGHVTGLRLPAEEVDRFVESRPIRCTHYDAFRFFTPEARPLNQLQPELNHREINEQPGCIHANMDLYKWAYKCVPWISGEFLLDCFSLAKDLRQLDMRASPYDLRQYGYDSVDIETADGRKQYEMEQRSLAERAAPMRAKLIAVLDRMLAV